MSHHLQDYRYVLLKCSLGCDSYLDIKGAKKDPGTQVVTWSRNADDNQVWYWDAHNECIRSRLNDFCLEFQPSSNKLIVNPFNSHNSYQKWKVHLPHICLLPDQKLRVTVADDNASRGADVTVQQESHATGQLWSFEEAGGQATPPSEYTPSGAIPKMGVEKRHFMISSTMSGDLVLDIRGDDEKEGAEVIVYSPNRKKNQLWYVGDDGYVRSCLNHMVFYGHKKGHSLKMAPYRNDPKYQWRVQGITIINGEGHCLDIRGGKGKKGSDLCAYDYKGDANQHWQLLY